MEYGREIKDIIHKDSSHDVHWDSSYDSQKIRSDEKLERYLIVHETLSDFPMKESVDEYIVRNSEIIWRGTSDFRKKCLIAEHAKFFDYFLAHPTLFEIRAEKLYAILKGYTDLDEEVKSKVQFITIASKRDRCEKYLGSTPEELCKKYPLDEKKIELMERIHLAKKRTGKEK